MNQHALIVGIDVAKNTLEVATDSATFRVANDEQGLQELVERLAPLKPELVVLEASGGYEKAAWLGLWSAGIKVARSIRAMRTILPKPAGSWPKPIASTPRGCARLGEQLKPPPTPVPSESDQELQELVRRRQQDGIITAERNRHQQSSNSSIRKSIARTLRGLSGKKAPSNMRSSVARADRLQAGRFAGKRAWGRAGYQCGPDRALAGVGHA